MTPSKPPLKILRHLTEASQTLHCRYSLPPNPAIIYAKFVPDIIIEDPYKAIENARQSLIKDAAENNISLLESPLPFVHISNGSITLWIFCIRSQDLFQENIQALSPKGKEKAPTHSWEDLETLCFDGLQRIHIGDFTPQDIFSCSATCATLSRSCPTCANATRSPHSWSPTSSILLPRPSLRDAYSMLICAVRERLVHYVCTPYPNKDTMNTLSDDKFALRAVRFGQGFLTIGECPDSVWGYGWEQRSQAKYLIHTALDIYFTLTAIYIRPMPSLTKLLPIPPTFSTKATPYTPLSPGTPLVLAPYPTPAFYISTHAPSTIPSSLRNEFWRALKGLGALHDSRTTHKRPALQPKSGVPESKFSDETFILVYISVNNPRGEPKGLPALWPAHLTFIDTDPNRIRLTTLPEIPSIETLLTPPRPSVNATSDISSMIASSSHLPNRTIFRNSSNHLRNTQRVMRTLELHTRRRTPGLPIHEAAKSTAGFVESVAKEREKEREKANLERLRREKESKDKIPSMSSGSGTPSQPLPASAPSTPTVSAATIPQKASPDTAVSTASWRSTSGQFFARTAQDTMSYSFYPSPPDCNLPHVSVTAGDSASGSFNLASAAVISAHHTSNTLQTPQDNMQTGSMGISNEMDLGMDIDLNDINIGINLSRSMDMMNVNVDSDLVDGGFGSFGDALITDDDFDYFDKTIVHEHIPSSTSHLDKDIPSWLGDALTSGTIISPVNPSPRRLVSEDASSIMSPELLPSTPTTRSPPTPNNPRTPSLEILNPIASPRAQLFEPINFSDRHHLADDKYTGSGGKFLVSNLQSKAAPPPTDAAIGKKSDSWRFRYDALTDPRVGVVNRLRGLKRKLVNDSPNFKSFKGGLREEEEWESMFIELEDGASELDSSSSQREDEELDNLEFDYDYAEVLSRESHSRPSTPSPVGHPLSPSLLYYQLEHSLLLPLAVPMRPSFKELVSSGTPSVAISVPTPVSPAAALGSASERNKTLELLAQAMSKEHVENSFWSHASGLVSPFSSPPRFIIPQEHINGLLNLLQRIPGVETSLPISTLLAAPPNVPPFSLSSSYKFRVHNQPKFSLGRAGLVHHILPSALRFWEKEGLGPRTGTKNVVAFCLFQDDEERASVVTSWLERVARTYSARNFGTHLPGDAGPFSKGLVPLRFESVRKVLTQLLTALSLIPHVPHIVIYIIAPPSLLSSLESPTLRSIIRSRKYASKLAGQRDFDDDRILFHFVPDNYIADPYNYPSTRHLGLEPFVQSVYDRLLRVCSRPFPSRRSINPAVIENRFHTPAFVLARSNPPEVYFQWEERLSFNVLDQHTFLHVGYRLTKCKKWLLAACIDERGEAHDVAVWNVPYHSEDDQGGGDIDVNMTWVVENVWLFASQFTKRSDTEWRIVLSRFDEIFENEVQAWITYLGTAIPDHQGPPFHVSLVCAQSDIPLALAPGTVVDEAQKKSSSTAGTPPGSVLMDASSLTYSVLFPGRAPIISTSHLHLADQPSILGLSPAETDSDNDADIISPFVETYTTPIIPLGSSALFTVSNACKETSDAGEATGDTSLVGALYIHMLYACKTSKSTLCKGLEEVLADITQSWYDISVLTKERWHMPNRNDNGDSIPLPFHLAALDVMLSLLAVSTDPFRKEVEPV